MSVKQIMTSPVITVELDDSIMTVKNTFDNNSFHNLLVVQGSKLKGVISDRDLYKALSPSLGTAAETTQDRAILSKRAHQIMSRDPVTLGQDACVFDAIEAFNINTIDCIPIVDSEQKPIGILSWRDILRAVGLKQRKPTSEGEDNKE